MSIATTVLSITAILALLVRLNYAFAPCALEKTTIGVDPGRDSSALFGKDTIFSLDDDDCDDKEHADDISGLLESLTLETTTDNEEPVSTKKKIGDSLRENNGVRPSIHPTTINAIAEALKARATQSLKGSSEDELHFRVTDDVEPLMVMVTAGQFASDAIQKRQESSQQDGMTMTQGEEQTVAGRVMGVIMRLDALEDELAERCASVDWVGQYNEWGNFGVLETEHSTNLAREETDAPKQDSDLKPVHQKILDDPLFCMNRAECLLAIFLQEVEIPQLEKLGESVPDGSTIDFLDQDRQEVVLASD